MSIFEAIYKGLLVSLYDIEGTLVDAILELRMRSLFYAGFIWEVHDIKQCW